MPERMWAEEVIEDLDLSLDLAIEQVDEPRYGSGSMEVTGG